MKVWQEGGNGDLNCQPSATYTGQQPAKGTGGIILGRVQLNLASLRLGSCAGLLELGGCFGAQLLRPFLGVVDNGVDLIKLRTSLVRGRLAPHLQTIVTLRLAEGGRTRESPLQDVLTWVEISHGVSQDESHSMTWTELAFKPSLNIDHCLLRRQSITEPKLRYSMGLTTGVVLGRTGISDGLIVQQDTAHLKSTRSFTTHNQEALELKGRFEVRYRNRGWIRNRIRFRRTQK